MKTKITIFTFIFIFSNLLSFSQIKVLSTGKVAVGGGTDNNAARFNISDTDNSTIYSKAYFTFGWGDAIKSEVNRTDAIAFSAWYNNSRNFMVKGNGDTWSATTVTWSDSTLKTNINAIEGSLVNLKKLNGVTYTMKNDKSDKKKLHIGLLAQEVEKVIPEIVYTDEHGVKGISYQEIIPLLIEAIKDQQIQIDGLTAQIEDCCKKNANLKSASMANSTGENITESRAQLDQNIPNPFSKETRIGCFIPDVAITSVLYIYNMNGTQLQQYNISGKGKQSVMIDGNSFQPGMYLYALVIDGQEVDTKRMILTK